MANPAAETVAYPFTSFNFSIEITVPGFSNTVCSAAFAECDGLELSMEVKTIREGGNNGNQVRLSGPFAFGQLTLKRGMTTNFDLWEWFNAALTDTSLRANAEVVLLAADGATERARFVLSRCLPMKLKTSALNAKDAAIAVEEFQMAYESLSLRKPGGGA